MPKPILAYWDFRGIAEPIRYLLYYKGVDFEDKRYASGDESWVKGREFNFIQRFNNVPECWMKEKFELGLDFPNLPYYIDGDVKLTQSTAILRYVARKHGMAGKTEEERVRVDLMEQQLNDFRMGFFMMGMNPDFANAKPLFVKGFPDTVRPLAKFLGDRKFLAGDSITYVDFIAYDAIDFYRYLSPKFLDQFPNLKKYFLRLKNLPELQQYFNSSTYVTWPIMNPSATFAGRGPEPVREEI